MYEETRQDSQTYSNVGVCVKKKTKIMTLVQLFIDGILQTLTYTVAHTRTHAPTQINSMTSPAPRRLRAEHTHSCLRGAGEDERG